MFQYALYYSLQKKGKTVKADLSRYEINAGTPREFLLEKLFGISLDIATKKEIQRLYAAENEIVKKAIIKRIGKKTYYREPVNNLSFHPNVFQLPCAYLEGFWQSENYFMEYRDELKQIYRFDIDNDINTEGTSIAIHVRMGDYLEDQYRSIYGGICTAEFYKKAIEYIRDKVDDPHFYVFSDDIEKAKAMFDDMKGFSFVDSGKNVDVSTDMAIMSICKHQIIANSSYSWWAAWLNDNPEKIIIAPSKWINGETMNDVICDSWVKI